MTKKIIIAIAGFAFFILFISIFRPVSTTERHSIQISGKIINAFATNGNDLFLRIKNDPSGFYINRYFDDGMSVDSALNMLMGQEVTLWYAKHWTPLDPKNHSKHINRLESNGAIFFNEFKTFTGSRSK